MKKILIIGSQGFLGSCLTDYLLKKNYDCVGTDVGYFQYGVLYKPQKVLQLNKDVRFLTETDLEGFDVVLMLAGVSNDPFGSLSFEEVYDPTREYAIKIAKICKKLGVRYIFPSSCSVYGIGEGMMDEDGVTSPQTPYSLNKIQIERDLAELADATFSPIALRLATVFGPSPRVRFDLVINMLCGMAITQKQVLLNSNGQAWRPHLYIDDVCEAFRCSIDWNYKSGSLLILNVGRNDNNWKIIDVAKLIQSKVDGCDLKFLGDEPGDDKDGLITDRKIQDGVDKRTYQVLFDRIYKTLPGFKSNWSIEQGIEQLLQDFERWDLDEVKFKQREFYRLQHMEHLYQTNQIDHN
jgi:nucleoside-diphosphate-sugar epimerase